MKKKLLTIGATFVLFFGIQSTRYIHSNPTGAPAAQTGAPRATTGFETTCAQSGCHGSSLNVGPNSVSITVAGNPDTLTAGQSYPITVKVENAIGNFAGFQMVALNPAKASSGTFTVGTGTKLVTQSGRSYITHSNRNNKTWNFTWKAPATLPDSVWFYVAAMAATGGYKTYTNKLKLIKNPVVTSVNEVVSNSKWTLFPNPVQNVLNLSGFPLSEIPLTIEIIGMDGREIMKTLEISNLGTALQLPAGLSNGVYILQTKTNKGLYSQRFIKQ
ncbi:MAG TPA: T9SS type A sorting domain-containing protein [Catalimonadaceae bacterium]|nr:T9SS type A sorting domain-containing protein [Catalimonadaceae bacterium]